MRALLVLIGVAAGVLPPLQAADYFLTIGGGYSPAGNQVSLEKNIQFYRRVLEKSGHATSPHALFFADGDAPGRDIQFEPAESDVPRANDLMAKLFGSEKYLHLEYRDHQLENVTGETSVANLEKWFKETGSKLKPGDRVILYATAHGGKSPDKKNPHNTKLYLWNTQSIQAAKLADLVHGLPSDVSLTLVMAQCYAGGFAHVIFNQADEKKGDQKRPISGFFATTHSRTAAGCTPDINEENYDEFSSHFWAAIHGETRTGESIQGADYDADGRISFEEAHAYTILTANTTDIPIKTSEVFLRTRSHFKDKEHPDLLPKTEPFSKIQTYARTADRTVLERLSKELGLTGELRYQAATEEAAEIEKKRKELANQDKQKKKEYDQAKKDIRNSLKARWPELSNVLTPQSVRLLTDQADLFVQEVERHSKFKQWRQLDTERESIADERFQLEKEWVKYQRFIRTLEHVILAENLYRSGEKSALGRYQQILTEEMKSLSQDS